MHMTHVIINFRRHLKRRNYSKHTVKYYLNIIKQYVIWVDVALELATPEKVDMYIDHLLRKRMNPASINLYLAIIRVFYDYLKYEEKVDLINPVNRNRRLRVPRPLPRSLRDHQVEKLFSVIKNKRDIAMFKLMLRCGLRVEEVCHLSLGAMDLKRRKIIVARGKGGEGRIVYINPEQKRLFGTLPEFFEFKDLRIHPDDSYKFRQYCKLINAYKIPTKDIELRFFTYDNTTKKDKLNWVNCRTSVIEYHDAKALLINMIDITRSKDLENRIQIREKMASLGQVVTNIAHEIRNPISGISLLLDCIANNIDSPDKIEDAMGLLNQAKSAVAKIESVIKRVLNFSRPNKCHFEYKNINIPIKETINLSYTALKKAGVDVQLDLTEGLPYAYLDSQLMEQALLNLINNAVEAMENRGKKVLRIKSLRMRDDIVIKIADSGEGIFLENVDKIFDPFFTTKVNGSGIGLSICQRIISDHGGTIKAISSI